MSRRAKLEQMLLDDPNDVFLHYAIAQEFVAEGDAKTAIERFDQLLQQFGDYVPAWFAKGRALADLSQFEDARSVLTEGIAVARQNRDDHAAREMQDALEMLP